MDQIHHKAWWIQVWWILHSSRLKSGCSLQANDVWLALFYTKKTTTTLHWIGSKLSLWKSWRIAGQILLRKGWFLIIERGESYFRVGKALLLGQRKAHSPLQETLANIYFFFINIYEDQETWLENFFLATCYQK